LPEVRGHSQRQEADFSESKGFSFFLRYPIENIAQRGKAAVAAGFIDFVASHKGQKLIRKYGKAKQHGEGLYNDAAYPR
jgi:ABC-type molybdate transport system substrate-binding protein